MDDCSKVYLGLLWAYGRNGIGAFWRPCMIATFGHLEAMEYVADALRICCMQRCSVAIGNAVAMSDPEPISIKPARNVSLARWAKALWSLHHQEGLCAARISAKAHRSLGCRRGVRGKGKQRAKG